MYPFNIKRTDKTTHTVVPGPIMAKLAPWLARNGIEYEVIDLEDMPSGIPCTCVFNGRKMLASNVCIRSNLDSGELFSAAEAMLNIREEEI